MQEKTETPQQRAVREREAVIAAERKAAAEKRRAELEKCADEVAEQAIFAVGSDAGECVRWFVLKLGAAGISPLTIRNAIDAE